MDDHQRARIATRQRRIRHRAFDNFSLFIYDSVYIIGKGRFMADEKKDSKSKRPTAKKRDIQNEKKRLQNRSFKSKIHSAIRTLERETADKKGAEAQAQLNTVHSLIDKGVKMGIYKLNKASRLKGKFSKSVTSA
jgi:small subunit ribosomal protein S20